MGGRCEVDHRPCKQSKISFVADNSSYHYLKLLKDYKAEDIILNYNRKEDPVRNEWVPMKLSPLRRLTEKYI